MGEVGQVTQRQVLAQAYVSNSNSDPSVVTEQAEQQDLSLEALPGSGGVTVTGGGAPRTIPVDPSYVTTQADGMFGITVSGEGDGNYPVRFEFSGPIGRRDRGVEIDTKTGEYIVSGYRITPSGSVTIFDPSATAGLDIRVFRLEENDTGGSNWVAYDFRPGISYSEGNLGGALGLLRSTASFDNQGNRTGGSQIGVNGNTAGLVSFSGGTDRVVFSNQDPFGVTPAVGAQGAVLSNSISGSVGYNTVNGGFPTGSGQVTRTWQGEDGANTSLSLGVGPLKAPQFPGAMSQVGSLLSSAVGALGPVTLGASYSRVGESYDLTPVLAGGQIFATGGGALSASIQIPIVGPASMIPIPMADIEIPIRRVTGPLVDSHQKNLAAREMRNQRLMDLQKMGDTVDDRVSGIMSAANQFNFPPSEITDNLLAKTGRTQTNEALQGLLLALNPTLKVDQDNLSNNLMNLQEVSFYVGATQGFADRVVGSEQSFALKSMAVQNAAVFVNGVVNPNQVTSSNRPYLIEPVEGLNDISTIFEGFSQVPVYRNIPLLAQIADSAGMDLNGMKRYFPDAGIDTSITLEETKQEWRDLNSPLLSKLDDSQLQQIENNLEKYLRYGVGLNRDSLMNGQDMLDAYILPKGETVQGLVADVLNGNRMGIPQSLLERYGIETSIMAPTQAGFSVRVKEGEVTIETPGYMTVGNIIQINPELDVRLGIEKPEPEVVIAERTYSIVALKSFMYLAELRNEIPLAQEIITSSGYAGVLKYIGDNNSRGLSFNLDTGELVVYDDEGKIDNAATASALFDLNSEADEKYESDLWLDRTEILARELGQMEVGRAVNAELPELYSHAFGTSYSNTTGSLNDFEYAVDQIAKELGSQQDQESESYDQDLDPNNH